MTNAGAHRVAGVPRIYQASPDRPIFRGLREGGDDLLCATCGTRLLENVLPDAVFDIEFACAGCSSIANAPELPAGRGLGGITRPVFADHGAVGTFVLDMDEVVVGQRAVDQRAAEAPAVGTLAPPEKTLDVEALRAVAADAKTLFAPVSSRFRRGHLLLALIQSVEENASALERGDTDVVALHQLFKLQRIVDVFRAWASDPAHDAILAKSEDRKHFVHDATLLQVAAMFQTIGLGPEFIPTEAANRTADLRLRISASHTIQLDTKTPQRLQRPEPLPQDLVISADLGDARTIVRKQLKRSRGQFTAPGIVVITGDFWVHGIDHYAESTRKLLSEQLAADASDAARAYHRRLLGVILISSGYEQIRERSFRSRLFMRWIPNPRYDGDIHLQLPENVEGTFRIGIDPLGSSATRDEFGDYASEPEGDPARFRFLDDGHLEVEGTIVNNSPDQPGEDELGRVTAWRFLEGQRPARDEHVDVPCEQGFTVVSVLRDGRFLVDPRVGWVNLHGIRFQLANAPEEPNETQAEKD
jgi:hypothetical protein